MTNRLALVVGLFSLFLEGASFASSSRCERDIDMHGPPAAGRAFWAQYCAPNSLKELWVVKMGQSKNTPYDTIVRKTVSEWAFNNIDTKDFRDRPFYPTYGPNGSKEVWKAPRQYHGVCFSEVPDQYIQGICRAKPPRTNSRILSDSGTVSYAEMAGKTSERLMKVSRNSTADVINLKVAGPMEVKQSDKKMSVKVYTIETETGASVTVGPGHVFVISSGKMKTPKSLGESDFLVKRDGSHDRVVSIASKVIQTHVYYVTLEKAIDSQGMNIEEGYLSATHWYRNDAVNTVNKRIYRHQFPEILLNP